MDELDLVVIGGGRSGLEAAREAVAQSARVALIERAVLGGRHAQEEAVTLGFAAASRAIGDARAARRLGFDRHELTFRFGRVTEQVRARVDSRPRAVLPPELQVLEEIARFVAPGVVAAGERVLTAKRIIIASGSRPAGVGVDGHDPDDLTLARLAELRVRPRSVAFVGATPSTLATAQALARLGCRVAVIDDSLAQTGLYANAVAQLFRRLEADGVRLYLRTAVVGISRESDGFRVALRAASGEGPLELEVAELVVTPSLQPDLLDLGLERAEVDCTVAGVRVDDGLRTSSGHVWAIGSAIGEPCPGSRGRHHARLAVRAALHGEKVRYDGTAGVRHIPTVPEVAVVGIDEREAGERGVEARSALIPLDEEGEGAFVSLVVDESDRVLGAASMSAHAVHLVGLVGFAVAGRADVHDLADLCVQGGPTTQPLLLAADRLRGARTRSTWKRLTGRFALR